MSFAVSVGIGSGTPGRLTPLCEATTPPTTTSHMRAAALDLRHAEADEPVVDEEVVPGLEHGSQHVRADGEVALARAVLAGDHDLRTPFQRDRRRELADPELRALQVGDQRDRPLGRRLGLAQQAGALRVVFVRPVGHVEPAAVHPRVDQSGDRLGRRRGRADRGHDLRASHVASCASWLGGTRPSPGTTHARRAAPRSAAAGCTSRCGRSEPVPRS